MTQGIVFNIQRFSVQDGPGIRSTVFLKGCPLRCQWCSNPESQKSFPELSHRSLLCNQCGKCLKVCDLNAISLDSGKITINRDTCNRCGKCIEVCSFGALRSMGSAMTVDEVLQEVLRDVDFYVNSGGGLTASGGEPCMQPEFVAELFQRAKQAGLHTTLDTCGSASLQSVRKVLQYTDLVLFDIKLMDNRLHQRFTGRSNRPILRNALEADALGIPQIIRIPLIPSINCFEQNIRDTASFVKGLKHKTAVNVLPYHRMGMSKYDSLDRHYGLLGEEVPPEEYVRRIRDMFLNEGIECEICE